MSLSFVGGKRLDLMYIKVQLNDNLRPEFKILIIVTSHTTKFRRNLKSGL